MRFKTVVEKEDKTLLEIASVLEMFDQEHFIAGVQARRRTQEEIDDALDMVQAFQLRMNVEQRALVRFSETFIGEFATDNNKCFETAERLFNRIRSTLCALKTVYQRTCKHSTRQLPEGAKQKTVWEGSALTAAEFQTDAFGLESYGPQVVELYNCLETLLTMATATLALCHRVIEDEKLVREDAEQLRQIYQESCQQLHLTINDMSIAFMDTQQVSETELEKRRKKAKSKQEFLRREYHNVDKREFKMYVVKEELRKGLSAGLTEEETFLFGNDRERVEQVRWAIEHYDELDRGEDRNKLNTLTLVYFLKWCRVKKINEKRLYEKYFCTNYKGLHTRISWSTVLKAQREKLHNVSDENAAQAFQSLIDDILEKKAP